MDEAIKMLSEDADQAAEYLGFMRSIIDNNAIPDRLNGSTAGGAWLISKSGVEQALILYCTRVWDDAKDAISLPNTVANFPTAAEVNKRREDDHSRRGINAAPLLDKEYANFQAAFAAAQKHGAHRHLRVLRSERFAHRVVLSRDRKKFEATGPIVNATITDLIALAEATVMIVGDMGYLWKGLANPYRGIIDRAEHNCREFWEHLPVYRKIEKAE